jgi:hypothetical protein
MKLFQLSCWQIKCSLLLACLFFLSCSSGTRIVTTSKGESLYFKTLRLKQSDTKTLILLTEGAGTLEIPTDLHNILSFEVLQETPSTQASSVEPNQSIEPTPPVSEAKSHPQTDLLQKVEEMRKKREEEKEKERQRKKQEELEAERKKWIRLKITFVSGTEVQGKIYRDHNIYVEGDTQEGKREIQLDQIKFVKKN